MKFSKILAATGIAGALITSGASPAAAYYPPDPWYNYNTSLVDRDTIRLAPANDVGSAYFYNTNIDYPVDAGDVVSYFVDTVGQTFCTYYYPYLYIEVDERYFTSYDDGTNCPGGTSSTQDDGTVSFTVGETGTLGYAEFAYYDQYDDNLNSVVEISDLRVNDEPIYFEVDPGPDPVPDPVPVATAYGANLTKPRPCRVKVATYHDAAPQGSVAFPQKREFVTTVDGKVRKHILLYASQTDVDRIRLRADTGNRTVETRSGRGRLLDVVIVRTRRC